MSLSVEVRSRQAAYIHFIYKTFFLSIERDRGCKKQKKNNNIISRERKVLYLNVNCKLKKVTHEEPTASSLFPAYNKVLNDDMNFASLFSYAILSLLFLVMQ